MANQQQFQANGATWSIDECLNGQSVLPFYDPLAQVALQKSLREETVLCYNQTGPEGLFAQMAALLGADERTVKSNPFYWTEMCNDETITATVAKSGGSVPAGGVAVTVNLAMKSMSTNGKFSMPRAGYRAYIKELTGQAVDIIAVNKSVTGAHTVTIKPINGEVLDLTKFSYYTLLISQLRLYVKGDLNCITTEGFVKNPPALRKGNVQKWEKGYCIHEDEIDGYAYGTDFRIFKGLDSNGKKIDMWSPVNLTNQIMDNVMDNRNVETMFGKYNYQTQQGVEGLIPTAEAQGMFSRRYDPTSGVSLKAHIMGMIKNLRKSEGCTDYMLLHDFEYGIDWTNGIAELVKASGQSLNYQLFGTGGDGVRNFKYFGFKDFEAFGYQFRTFMIDMFDKRRYGNFLSNFALLMPACKYKDTGGKVVPPVTYVNIAGSEPAKQKNVWTYNEMQRGCRVVNVFAKDAFGLEIHCASKLGVMRKAACY